MIQSEKYKTNNTTKNVYEIDYKHINYHFLLPLLVLVLVTVLVELELMVSESLFVFVAVAVFVCVCVMVGVFVFVCVMVTFVLGDPMSEIVVVMGTCWEATQASPAPSPGTNTRNIK